MYFSGDGAVKDENGFIQITGRMDDVINISGHRLGTAEIEDVMVRIKHQISIFGARNFLCAIRYQRVHKSDNCNFWRRKRFV